MEATKISIKLIVDRKANKVVLAEAGKEFVDFLFHLLSLPIGSVVGLLSGDTTLGCIGNLYKSIEDLNDEYDLHPNRSKDLLLKPGARNSSSVPLLLPNNHVPPPSIRKLYGCFSCGSYVSEKNDAVCPSCRSKMTRNVTCIGSTSTPHEGGFVKGGLVNYMVMDDLSVTPISMIVGIAGLSKCKIRELDALEERIVDFGIDEGLQLLRASVQSTEVLTDVFLEKEESKEVPVSMESGGRFVGINEYWEESFIGFSDAYDISEGDVYFGEIF